MKSLPTRDHVGPRKKAGKDGVRFQQSGKGYEEEIDTRQRAMAFYATEIAVVRSVCIVHAQKYSDFMLTS
jgi:hypothetical protein